MGQHVLTVFALPLLFSCLPGHRGKVAGQPGASSAGDYHGKQVVRERGVGGAALGGGPARPDEGPAGGTVDSVTHHGLPPAGDKEFSS